MVKPALLPRYCGSLACLGLLLGSTNLFAQAKPADNSKIQSEEAVFIPIEYRPPPFQISVGVRISGKAKVKFSGLGSIPTNATPGADTTTVQVRKYHDGAVRLDTNVDINSKYVENPDGKTNYWSFTRADQVVDHPTMGKSLAFHSYEVSSRDVTAEADNSSSTGWDVEISRELGSSRIMSWGLLFGGGIGNINCKTSGTIKANLRTHTDYYSLAGVTLGTDLTFGDSYTGIYEYYVTQLKKDADGKVILDSDGYPTYERVKVDG